MNQDLESIAATLVADGKGILAADESVATLTRRFDTVGIKSTEQSRRALADLPGRMPGRRSAGAGGRAGGSGDRPGAIGSGRRCAVRARPCGWLGLPANGGQYFLLDTVTLSVLGYYRDVPALEWAADRLAVGPLAAPGGRLGQPNWKKGQLDDLDRGDTCQTGRVMVSPTRQARQG